MLDVIFYLTMALTVTVSFFFTANPLDSLGHYPLVDTPM